MRLINTVFLLFLGILPPLSFSNMLNPAVLTQNTSCRSSDIQYPFAAIFNASLDHLLSPALPGFEIYCNGGSSPMLSLGGRNYLVINISVTDGFVRIAGSSVVSWNCGQNSSGPNPPPDPPINLDGTPYTFSSTSNLFTAIGCDAMAVLRHHGRNTGCVSFCSDDEDDAVFDGSCSGLGCCQAAIPSGLKSLELNFSSVRSKTRLRNHPGPCSRAFIIDKDWFRFSKQDLDSLKEDEYRPVVLDWWIGNRTCKEAKMVAGGKDYACKSNSHCIESTNGAGGGYRCNCPPGYSGNPYIGCDDIDECSDSKNNPCVGKCHNKQGSFGCSCPWGTHGDGLKHGTGCKKIGPLEIGLGVGLGFLVMLVVNGYWIYLILKKHKAKRVKQRHFLQNGGLLLRQHISVREATARIFTSEELKKATNNFHESRILGRGGNGVVYKGFLSAGTPVAIKKSRLVDESQIEQFINEVLILSQVRHRNVVKLLGCCLETSVPLLVYEFIPNGTLYHHLHIDTRSSNIAPISWENRIRIAVETAAALAYLHCIAVVPIIHRDVKSSNILLDEDYRARVSDFGASRLLPYNHTHITTLVQGTLGYLDPEYFQSSLLTDKSDVYSFGVVLLELLTKEKPIVMEKSMVSRFMTLVEENRVLDAMDEQTLKEAGPRHLLAVADLARRCLSLKGDERPSMKEVMIELEALRRLMRLHFVQRAREEKASLLNECSHSVSIRDIANEYIAEAHLLASEQDNL